MSRFKIFSTRTAAAVLSAAMMLQGTAMAAPLDELSEVLENQQELKADSLLEETLGWSELKEAMGDNGLQIQLKTGFDPQTAAALGEELLEKGYGALSLQIDKKLEKWLLGASLGSEEDSLLDISLYGDTQQLALSLPQFYAGALALKAGNFKEQLLNSDLAVILGITEEDASQIPEFDMSFYPEEDSLDEITGVFGGMKERLEDKAEEMKEDFQVEKTESGDMTTYAVTVDTADVMDIYEIVFEEYISLFTNSGLAFSVTDLSEMNADLDQMLSEMESLLGESITMDFDVRDGLLEKISYDLYIDTAALEQEEETIETSVIEEIAAKAGEASDAVPSQSKAADENAAGEITAESGAADENAADETAAESGVMDVNAAEETAAAEPIMQVEGSFRGYVSYEIIYTDPAQPAKGFEIRVKAEDENSAEQAVILMNYATETEGTTETSTLSLDLQENDESIYSGTLYTASFDSATGDLDAVFSIVNEDSAVGLKLDGTFTEIEKGKSFVLNVDELSMTADGEKAGLNAEVRVSADPGEIAAPADSRVVLELTQGGLLDLVNEISANAQAWSAQFEPELETELENLESEVIG
ncbi:MAG: hypothetical protein Q4C61_06960 [Lachnospiraceae bacterium]|nr:hypothetical protein [Lachnospiraceae bacterium]